MTYDFEQGGKYAISGANGSGKSTLLKIIAGIITPNQGSIGFKQAGKTLLYGDISKQVSYCAPYMDLPEELTVSELLNFHCSLRKLIISKEQFTELLELEADKEIRNYSSGMKQRLKLGLAFYTESSILLLDEPTATLDKHWIDWYFDKIEKLSAGKMLVISSNIPEEYQFCPFILDLGKYKI